MRIMIRKIAGIVLFMSLLVSCNEKMPENLQNSDINDSGSETVAADTLWFFSDEDLNNIRKNASTTWGQEMVASYEKTVRQRLKYPLSVPQSEGGYGHHYYCPSCNVELTFAFATPTSHVCPECNTIYSGGVYDAAWISEVHNRNLNYLSACMYLYVITGDQDYAASIAFMLDDYAENWLKWEEHSVHGDLNTAGRLYAQSLEDAKWFSDAAVIYKVVKHHIPEAIKEKIEKEMFAPAAEMLKERKQTSNWQTWHNAAIASIGVAIGDRSLVEYALYTPVYGYEALLGTNLYADGWWNEGSVTYHFYALQAMLKTAEAVRCLGINLYRNDLRKMFDAPMNSVYSDLSMVTHNDGWTGATLTSYARYYNLAYLRYGCPTEYASVLGTCWAKAGKKGAECLLNPNDLSDSQKLTQKSCVYDNIGYAVLHKNRWSVVMKYGPHGGSHGHPDKLSITFHDGEKEILPDFGSPAYSVPAFGGWYKNTLSHNTVVVDGRNQEAVTGELMEFTESSVKAKVSGAYTGVEMERSVAFGSGTITDIFTVTGQGIHTYDYVLLPTECPSYTYSAVDSDLGYSGPYSYINNVKKLSYVAGMSLTIGDQNVSFAVEDGSVDGIYLGESLGYPYQNAPTATCWPVIIRVKGDKMKVKSVWSLD